MQFPSAPAAPVALQPSQTSQLSHFSAAYRPYILGGTVVGHFAHWRYLTSFRRLDPSALTHQNVFRFYGAAWGCVYLGVISALAFVEREAAKRTA